MTAPVCVWPASSSFLARPKSVIFGVPSVGQQDVGRLQVAVDDAAARGPRASPAPASRTSAAASRGGSGVPSSLLVQAAAVAELQREERQAVVLADLVDLHDVRVLQAGRRPRPRCGSGPGRSAPAWPPARIIFRATTRFRPTLPGLVDDAHAAAAQLAQDLVAGDGDRPIRGLGRFVR